jgi:hypothetical protein
LRLILKNQSLEFTDVFELPPIRQLSMRFDWQRIIKIKWPAVLAKTDLGHLVLGVPPIAIPPRAHDIEAFEGKALRIDLNVTHRAALIRAMLV